jgi:hypothetical protein
MPRLKVCNEPLLTQEIESNPRMHDQGASFCLIGSQNAPTTWSIEG